MRNGTKFKMGDKIKCLKTPRYPSNIVTGDIAVVVPISTAIHHQGQVSKLALCVLRKGSKTVKTKKTYCLWKADESCYNKIGEMEIPIKDIIKLEVQTLKEKEGVSRDGRDFGRVSKQKQSGKDLRNKRRK